MIKNILKFFRDSNYKDIRNVIFWYLSFLIVVIVVFIIFKHPVKAYLDKIFDTGFYTSVLASFMENFAFFGVIGLITQFISMKKPEDHEFQTRVEAVANAAYVSREAKDFLIVHTKKILAFNKNSVVKVIIKDFNKDKSAIKLYTEFTNTIVNMCKDINYTFLETNAEVHPDMFINGIGGEVTHLTMTDKFTNETIIEIEGDVVELKEGQGPFRRKIVDREIAANSEVKWKFAYWIWSRLEDSKEDKNWYFASVNRFTSDFKITIKNESSYNVKFEYRYPNSDKNGDKFIKKDRLYS